MKHTPGPWKLDSDFGIVYDSTGTKCIETGGAACSEETKANARLIAAAPEMLAALKKLRKADFAECDEPTWIEIQEAIAKAEGKQSVE